MYKALIKHHLDLDLIAGTSIGGINAAIIAGSRNKDRPDQLLEEFWLELSENFVNNEKFFDFSRPSPMKQFYENFVYPLHKNDMIGNYVEMKKGQQMNSNHVFKMCRMCRTFMCRALAERNVSQRAPRVVLLCVVEECVAYSLEEMCRNKHIVSQFDVS